MGKQTMVAHVFCANGHHRQLSFFFVDSNGERERERERESNGI